MSHEDCGTRAAGRGTPAGSATRAGCLPAGEPHVAESGERLGSRDTELRALKRGASGRMQRPTEPMPTDPYTHRES